MSSPITTTIDKAGRLVIPKDIREQAGLRPGALIEVRLSDGRVELEQVPREVTLARRGRITVAVPVEEREPLTEAQVRRTVRRLRERNTAG